MRFFDEHEFLKAIGKQMGMPVVDLRGFQLVPELLRIVPEDTIRERRLIPLQVADGILRVATADPYDITAFDDLRMQTGLRIEPVLASESEILRLIREQLP